MFERREEVGRKEGQVHQHLLEDFSVVSGGWVGDISTLR